MRIMRLIAAIAALLCGGLLSGTTAMGQSANAVTGQGANDANYTKQIRQYTTEPFLTTKLVDHLPASSTVPTPERFLGHIVGAPGYLTYSKDIYAYYRALAKASPRVKVFSAGKTEEGREFLLVAVSDADNIAQLDRYRAITAKLADPRTISDDQAKELEQEGKPFYWASASIHSPETGSPEMLMELAYRLAVEDTPFIRNIRKNTIFLITPIVEVDGHDRMVDVFHYHKANPTKPAPRLVYWGHYVAHDNNRDAIAMGLQLSQMMMREFFDFHPQVLHDLHESVPYLYVSTGTGPYNAWLDPIVISEWEKLAANDVEKLTAAGVFGVWDHGYYDGWAPNYMFFVANGHNSIGRFYETFGNMYPDTRMRKLEGDRPYRKWFRPNPPLQQVLWSFRDNTNLEESGLLYSLDYTANHRQELLADFYLKSKRAVAKATAEGPAAWAIENDGARPGLAAKLARLLQSQGAEVCRLNSEFHVKNGAASTMPGGGAPDETATPSSTPAGAAANAAVNSGPPNSEISKTGVQPTTTTLAAGTYIVRMDQPYSRIADMLLDRQYYSIHDPTPYDDTGWSLGPLFNVRTERIADPAILKADMSKIDGPVHWTNASLVSTSVANAGGRGARFFLVNANAEPALASLRFRLPDIKFFAANDAFVDGGKKFNAGSFIVPSDGNPANAGARLETAAHDLGLRVYAANADPKTARHPIDVPRVALLHTWTDTQNEGWFRLAFDRTGVGYSYISTTVVRETPDLRAKYDVILVPPVRGGAAAILNGIPKSMLPDGSDFGGPIPWKKTALTPNLGLLDHADDIRGGLGFQGLANLKKFVDEGGLLIAVGSSSQMATDFGLAPGVRIERTPQLHAKGSVYLAHVEDAKNPIAYGYGPDVPVYFNQSPVFQVAVPVGGYGGGYFSADHPVERTSGRGSLTDPDIPQGRKWIAQQPMPQLTRVQRETYVDPEALLGAGVLIPPKALWPRVVLRFSAHNLLVSGMLTGGDELEDTPAIVDVPEGRGHVLLFANNPMWRQETEGSFMLLFNAILNFNALDIGRKTGVQAVN